MLATLASDKVIDDAYQWLCHQRRHWPADADIWDFRFHWASEKRRIQAALVRGAYRIDALSRVTKNNGETIHVWSSRDALVLKALAIVLADHLPVSIRCTHVKGHGGAKGAVRAVQKNVRKYTFVMRTDVKGYYDNIDHSRMIERLGSYVKDRTVLSLLWQIMRRTVTWGGLYRDYDRGISRGCPLSPLLGAFFLHELDTRMAERDVFYVRYMDDIVILTRKRWHLRKAVRCLNSILARLELQKARDKTFIGNIEKGFDFLGYHFGRKTLTLATTTIQKMRVKYRRLYEQTKTAPDGAVLRAAYLTRWVQWAAAGLPVSLNPNPLSFTDGCHTCQGGRE